MKMDVEINGMKVIDGDREAAKNAEDQIPQAYSEKLKEMKEGEADG